MTGLAGPHAPSARGELGDRISLAAAITFYISAGCYLGLFVLMWGPVYAGYEGWMFMYPIFLLAWIPVELGAIATIALGVVSVVRADRPQSGRRRGWMATIGGGGLAVISLPLLWFGNFPYALLTGSP